MGILIEWGGVVKMAMRDANAFDGLGHDQCRPRQRLMGADTLRFGMAAARTPWCMDHAERRSDVNLCHYRPWYRQKGASGQLDLV